MQGKLVFLWLLLFEMFCIIIIFVFIKAFPLLSDLQQEKLLAFAEGMAFMAERNKEKEIKKIIENQ
jgi:hypothetical protein